MKLIVQIPCLNEEATLAGDAARPSRARSRASTRSRSSSSTTAPPTAPREVARAHGADHVVRFTRHKGLAAGFMAGLDACLRLGADVIVNTDADNQYPGHEIPRLIAPILAGEADMVVGRPRRQRGGALLAGPSGGSRPLGSWVVRKVSGTRVPDTTSGFRALTREAALRINIVSEFTYTLESIIQAGKKKHGRGAPPHRGPGRRGPRACSARPGST